MNDKALIIVYETLFQTNWASPDKPFGKFVYRTYSEEDFNVTNEQYSYKWWIFTKPNLTQRANPKSVEWQTNLTTLYRWEGNSLKTTLHLNVLQIGIQ